METSESGATRGHVEVFSWNPRRRVIKGPRGMRLRYGRRVGNFGDLLGPMVVRQVARELGCDLERPRRDVRLLSVGSVMHFGGPATVVWGSGVNGKIAPDSYDVSDFDVRAVRGPRTMDYLWERGVRVQSVFGDPALLLPLLRPDLVNLRPTREILAVPNLNDLALWTPPFLHPCSPVEVCLRTIATSAFVVASSLHAIVVAESLGIPARLVRSAIEPDFKYDDYYRGTGRDGFSAVGSVEEGIEAGGEPPIQWSPEPLMEAFPTDLWHPVTK